MRRLLLLFLVFLGCGGGGHAVTQTGNPSQVSLYFERNDSLMDTAATVISVTRAATVDTTTPGGGEHKLPTVDSIEIIRAEIVVSEVLLAGTDSLVFEQVEPYVLSLTDYGRQEVDSAESISGYIYDSLFIGVASLPETSTTAPHLAGNSIYIELRLFIADTIFVDTIVDNYAFTLPLVLTPPLEVNNKSSSALLIGVDVAHWFWDEDEWINTIHETEAEAISDIRDAIEDSFEGDEEDEDDWDEDEED